MSRKGWIITAVIVSALLTLILCGGVAAVVAYRSMGSGQGAQSAAPTATAPAAVIPAGAGGGQVRLVGSMPPTLDPALVQDSTSGEHGAPVQWPVALNADLEVIPALAERWDTSADGCTFTFYLHPEAAFGDGKPLDAAAVASPNAPAAPELASPVALSYLDDTWALPPITTVKPTASPASRW